MRNYGTWFGRHRHPSNDRLTGCVFLGARGVRYCGTFSLLHTNAGPPEIDIAENVEEVKLICILVSIYNCPIYILQSTIVQSMYIQPESCHHQASGLAAMLSVFPLGVRQMGTFPCAR